MGRCRGERGLSSNAHGHHLSLLSPMTQITVLGSTSPQHQSISACTSSTIVELGCTRSNGFTRLDTGFTIAFPVNPPPTNILLQRALHACGILTQAGSRFAGDTMTTTVTTVPGGVGSRWRI